MTILQRRAGCEVATAPDGRSVVKTFTGEPPELMRELALREFERLRDFGRALRDVEGASCPQPLELVEGARPQVRMTRAPGVTLWRVLRERPFAADVQARLARVAAQALDAYVATFHEPYWDFQFDNMLFDEPSGTLTFLDFGIPPGDEAPAAEHTARAVSLGNLVGSTIFQSARPGWVRHRRQHRQALALCAAIVEAAAAGAPQPPGAGELARFARAAYVRSAWQGSVRRRLWYVVAAPLVGGRVRVGQQSHRPWPWPLPSPGA